MKLVYHLTQAARQRIFVETGRDPEQVQALEIDPATLSADDRRLLIEIEPTMGDSAQLTLPRWDNGSTYRDHLVLDALATDVAELLAVYRDARASGTATYVEAREAALDSLLQRYATWDLTRGRPQTLNEGPYIGSPRLGDLRTVYYAVQDRFKERERAVAEAKRADEVRKEAARTQHEQERAAWVAQHGSPRLRKCLDQGYDCQRLYAIERAAIEYPGYILDYNDAARWKDRSGPSEAALDEAARVSGIVVWLTAEPSAAVGDDPDYGVFESCEAVIIREYLGKYDLVKIL